MARENYIGRAGQLAVMSELLLRGYNVAIPEVDEGDDVLVIQGRGDDVWRIQVKTAVGVPRNYGYSGQFQVPLGHLHARDPMPLFYLFAIRRDLLWEFVPISQRDLTEVRRHRVGSQAGTNRVFYLAFRPGQLLCSGRDWQRYRGNWNPGVRHGS